MSQTPIKIAMISGSLRKGSFNTKLLKCVDETVSGMDQVELDHISLSELDLPMFNEDLEAASFPESALELKRRLIAADGVLISSPEYNGSFSGALKNAIDWASRPRPDEESLACFKGKVCALLAASPGAIGGLRGIRHVRQVLTQLQMHVIPQEFALGKAHEAFDDNGQLKEEFARNMANNVGQSLVKIARMHKSAL
ncbi:MAG: NAD(P)H-dependent oxidoreductase [Phycisphaerales bacterium]|nr:NAD(P)H-dependent oxidoreductase [Phycisphaerales bacterium]